MAILQRLTDLGFINAAVLNEKDGVSLVRIRTSKGWVYERFNTEADVDRWANYHQPEKTA